MNGYLVIAVFTVILAATVYWLQSRQARQGSPKPKDVPEKIEVVKASDWEVKEPEKPVEEKPEEPKPEETEETPEPEPSMVEERDISQLSGVGPKYRTLLKEAGITTVNQVAEMTPEDLLAKLIETNERTEITKRPPTHANVTAWIESAKTQLE